MRLLIFIFIIIFSFSGKSQYLEKCKGSFNSYSLEKCLTNLKYKLVKHKLEIPIIDLYGNLYREKLIFVNICGKHYSKITSTSKTGLLNLTISREIIDYCPSLITLRIQTGFGLCLEGNPAKAVWNSLKMQEIIYLDCDE